MFHYRAYIAYHTPHLSNCMIDIIKTLPEAQRTQGIESMTCIIFLTEINLKLLQLKKISQVLNSIPWVRCASGNVLYIYVDCRVLAVQLYLNDVRI